MGATARPPERVPPLGAPRCRVAIIASHVIQYQAPFFRLLAAVPDIELTVLYCSPHGAETYHDVEMQTTLRWDLDLLSGYRHLVLRGFGIGTGYTRRINPGILFALLRGRYDAVIFFLGWGTVTSLLGMAVCRLAGIPFLLWSDSSFPPPEDTFWRRLRARALRGVLRRAQGFLVSGELNADYYRHYGVERNRMFLVPLAIDNERFSRASSMTADDRRELRSRFGVHSDQIAIIFSAKLLPRKDPLTLLRAIERMRHRARAVVVFLGDGELRGNLETYARENGIAARFAGFLNQTELPRHYAMGDVFVLPSIVEPRGVVINEAMVSGLPVVVTDRCGSIRDIVRDGDNGFVYPAGDADTLAERLDELAESHDLRERMGQRSREIIAGWDFERGVAGVREALAACRCPQPR
jgi:glycosyltransferase involved in cell wall biosynthesis